MKNNSKLLFVGLLFVWSTALLVRAETATTTISITPPKQCADMVDNDGDGFIDYPSDPGCSSGADDDETDPVFPQCADGADNDLDGRIDYPADPGCDSVSDDDELDPPPTPSGGGGGSVSILRAALSPAVSLSGFAFPGASIRVLRDGVLYARGVADVLGAFSIDGTSMTSGSYVFTVIAERGAEQSTVSFLSDIERASKVTLGDVFLPPTISVSSSAAGSFRVSGLTVPFAALSVVRDDAQAFGNTTAGSDGSFVFDFDSPASIAVAVAARAYDIESVRSPFVRGIFSSSRGRGDLNGDGQVNLIDFSILVFWYESPDAPSAVDFSGDGQVTLEDISIMLFYWTG